METWPPTEILPAFTATMTADTDVNTLRLEMEAGTIRQRRRFTENRAILNVSWSFTNAEFAIFTAFLEHKLNNGADAFTMAITLGGGVKNYTVRFMNGRYTFSYVDTGYWNVNAVLETILSSLGFCIPNVAGFLTNPNGAVSLAAYFGPIVTTPEAATQWRIITDDCGYNIQYYLGTINPDGTLNPGVGIYGLSGTGSGSGWYSESLEFRSTYLYAEGMYIQVACGGVWGPRPCIAGGHGTL